MSDFTSPQTLPLFVHTFSRWGPAQQMQNLGQIGVATNITWPSANMAFYVPMWIPWSYPVSRVWWSNGSSVSSTNMDFGIYTAADGTKIYSTGSTAAVGASATQYVTPATPFMLYPGRYYFALSDSSGAAGHGFGVTASATAPNFALAGMLQEASALPLPATMTPVTIANVCFPLCGITRTTTGF